MKKLRQITNQHPHGMTDKEWKEFKHMKELSRNMKNKEDIMKVKKMASDWVKSAPSIAAWRRRGNMTRAIHRVYAQFKEEK